MKTRVRGGRPGLTAGLLGCLIWWGAFWGCLAGGSGLNVAVVVNADSPASLALGNYYRELRGVPAAQVFRIRWGGGPVEWSRAEFESRLLVPFAQWLESSGLTSQVDYVVLSMDIPYRVVDFGTNGPVRNSTTSVLFYGWRDDANAPGNLPRSCSLPSAALHSYAGSEMPFRNVTGRSAWSNWLATMITASNLPAARAIVDRGVLSDETWPTQAVYLLKSTDTARNVRHWAFDDVILEQRVLGRMTMIRTNANSPSGLGLQLGSQSGSYGFSLPSDLFVPGAMADNLTSYGGWLFEDAAGMTRVPDYIAAGATASYGTVVEPCNWTEKFPAPRNYFYQARGFSIAECYYQSVEAPYQGVLVGEPLAAPFARRPQGRWESPGEGATVSGTIPLQWQFVAVGEEQPVGRVDLFVDGRFRQTLWERGPQAGNRVELTLAGQTISHTVSAGSTLADVAAGLAAEINRSEHTNQTGVIAEAIGDRLLLRSVVPGRAGVEVPVSVATSAGAASERTLFAHVARPYFVDSTAQGYRVFRVRNLAGPGHAQGLTLTVTGPSGQVTVSVQNLLSTNTAGLVAALVAAVNEHPDLQGPDGVRAEDYDGNSDGSAAEFALRARSPGWAAAAALSASLSVTGAATVEPAGTQTLEENLEDLQPRNHLYLAAGVTNLALTFAWDTTREADGWHECTAVAYEGTHVATQGHLRRTFRVVNTGRTAALTPWNAGPLTKLGSTLRWRVTVEPGPAARVELHTTGGAWAAETNVTTALFEVPGPDLGEGLHPFFAVVTWPDGVQYRTETHWVRLIPDNAPAGPLRLEMEGPPWRLRWPVVVGRTYTVWSTDDLGLPFQARGTWVATNSPMEWIEPAPHAGARFYRVSEQP
ncbi:TIGR03790 family protein [Limisphaera ngatamarikiensis]|uniref:TIGR03790 family protein n=1 Tax=Limisphaera ngatamarikiensis TaxID=1324935 RepID=UPI00197EF6C9